MTDWLDIESAPRDGTKVLGFTESGHRIVWWKEALAPYLGAGGHDAGWESDPGEDGGTFPADFFSDGERHGPYEQPTHWMPLPDPPAVG